MEQYVITKTTTKWVNDFNANTPNSKKEAGILKKGTIIDVQAVDENKVFLQRGGWVNKEDTKPAVKIPLTVKLSVIPIGFYAFSKYQKYDNKKTAKVTIIGSVVVLGLVVLNGFSGAWSGTTFMDRTFGQQKYW
jgi:hypothetical protein